ncbi:hypothetical protein L596_020556 [Steinernema carpocapsae]|uniref:Uncharacterized protein n=2 Tax=Steinernema carpocapsae TaxID=34508 RepID=A0A4U5MTZ0_STECR|nr:hypothetical protein L596_020556 [Steinernema carpocapsae]
MVITTFNLIPSIVLEIVNRSYYVDDEVDNVHCIEDNISIQMAALTYNIYLSIGSAVAACLIYGIIIFCLFSNRRKFKGSNTSTKHANSAELKLTLSVLLHSVLLTVDGCTAALIFVGGHAFFMPINYFVQDLLSGCNPYLLIAFSSELRKKVFWWKKPEATQVVSGMHNTNPSKISIVTARTTPR